MIKGNKTHLVAFEQGHWPFIYKWMSDPIYKYYFRNIPHVMTQTQCANFSEIMGMNILMILESHPNEFGDCNVIGMATWDNVRMLARTCDIGFLIDKDFQGKGYTKDAFMHFMNYLFTRLGFHKVSAKVAEVEVKTSEKTKWGGFSDSVILRDEFFMDGKWQNDVLLSVLDYEFKERFNKFTEREASWAAAEKVVQVKHLTRIN